MKKRKYKTAAAFKRAVKAYFESVSHTVYVTADGGDGIPRRVLTDDGKYIARREFLVPPTISGLCLYIGISRQTWSEYADRRIDAEYAEICADAKLMIAAYLEEQLLCRRKGVQGIIFNLKNNYGWTEKADEAAKDGMGDDNPTEGMSIDDKMALISDVAALIEEDASDA